MVLEVLEFNRYNTCVPGIVLYEGRCPGRAAPRGRAYKASSSGAKSSGLQPVSSERGVVVTYHAAANAHNIASCTALCTCSCILILTWCFAALPVVIS